MQVQYIIAATIANGEQSYHALLHRNPRKRNILYDICWLQQCQYESSVNTINVTVRVDTATAESRCMCIIIDSDSRACKHASFNVSPASQVLTVILRQDERASPAAVQTQCTTV